MLWVFSRWAQVLLKAVAFDDIWPWGALGETLPFIALPLPSCERLTPLLVVLQRLLV